MVSGSEKHLCECGRRLGSISHKKHANAGFVRRKDHDMCERCFQAALDKARHAEHANSTEVVI